MRAGFHGLTVGARSGNSVDGTNPHSGMVDAPTSDIPIVSMSLATPRVRFCGGAPSRAAAPQVHGRPATGTMSLMNVGRPSNEPRRARRAGKEASASP